MKTQHRTAPTVTLMMPFQVTATITTVRDIKNRKDARGQAESEKFNRAYIEICEVKEEELVEISQIEKA